MTVSVFAGFCGVAEDGGVVVVVSSGVVDSGVELSGLDDSGDELSGVELSGVLDSGVELSGLEDSGEELSGVEDSGTELSAGLEGSCELLSEGASEEEFCSPDDCVILINVTFAVADGSEISPLFTST